MVILKDLSSETVITIANFSCIGTLRRKISSKSRVLFSVLNCDIRHFKIGVYATDR